MTHCVSGCLTGNNNPNLVHVLFFQARLEMEIQHLLKDIKRVGDPEKPYATFAELFDDDEVANYYEALVGTLKAAKKKGLVSYQGQILLKGISDNVVISIV
jgi:Costars